MNMELNDLKREIALRVANNLRGQNLSIQSIIEELFEMECLTEKRSRIALSRSYFLDKYNADERRKLNIVQQAAAIYSVSERSVYNAVTEFED